MKRSLDETADYELEAAEADRLEASAHRRLSAPECEWIECVFHYPEGRPPVPTGAICPCGKPVLGRWQPDGTSAIYCSNACRQKCYRQRVKERRASALRSGDVFDFLPPSREIVITECFSLKDFIGSPGSPKRNAGEVKTDPEA
jgi:hypothetical protein